MNDPSFIKAVRQRLVVLLALHDDGTAMGQLAIRFGSQQNANEFTSGLPPELWYPLFEHMSSAPNVVVRSSRTHVEQDGDCTRIIHEPVHHRACYKESKKRILALADFPLTAALAVRVGMCTETRAADNMCNNGQVITPQFLIRSRERCSLYLIGPQGHKSCWRFDFTRINTDLAYELKLELELARALRQTAGQTDDARIQAIMSQLTNTLQWLMASLHKAEQLYWRQVAFIKEEREQRRLEQERELEALYEDA